ncbi:MAG: glycine--tRNA ligase subunit beta, partial [Gammaproteobacteria bacterium]|nr:glycine--tRNA ligase subunit beta [Gammaproteobacteria bacterium]
HDSEPETVCQAIEQQYWPRHAGDRLPDNGVAQALAIADRIDTIVGIFAIGKRPTGTRDPFALRRSALGVLRMLIECRLDVDLAQLIAVAAQLQPVAAGDDVRREVLQYFLDRLRGYYVDDATAAVTPQVFDAVVATMPTVPVDFDARIAAVKEFAGLEAADALAAANKRIGNILRSAESRPAAAVDPQQLSDAAEVALYDALQSVAGEAEAALVRRDYVAVLTALASLRPAIDRFFDDVMVMSENPDERANRLALLQQLRSMFLGVADVSRLQVG